MTVACATVDDADADPIEIARAIAETTLRRNATSVDESGAWPEDSLRALQRAGLAGLVLPKEVGGLGGGLLSVALVCETLGRECASTAICFGMHLVGSAVLAAKATPSQRTRYLEPIARGEHLTTLALSESGTGSHFYLPETRITPTPAGYAIDGGKSFVTNGGYADSYVVSVAPPESSADAGEFSCVVIDAKAPGMLWRTGWQGWGLRGNTAHSVTFEHVQVLKDALLGEAGDEIWYVFNVVAPFFLVAMAGTYLGATAAALDAARAHILDRRYSHTGSSVAESTVVQHRVGELWARVQRTRSLIYDARRMGDAGEPDALAALCSAKAEVAEISDRVVADAMTPARVVVAALGDRDLLREQLRFVAQAHRVECVHRDPNAVTETVKRIVERRQSRARFERTIGVLNKRLRATEPVRRGEAAAVSSERSSTSRRSESRSPIAMAPSVSSTRSQSGFSERRTAKESGSRFGISFLRATGRRFARSSAQSTTGRLESERRSWSNVQTRRFTSR
jgi:alkylation response protein AidB-like acyl-CoA dehydrogenase